MTIDKEAIERTGYGISGDIGGIAKQTYFTPDGRRIRAIPCMRDYITRKDGKVIESGTRDANYDKGWLPVMPTALKSYCSGCDKWHDTKEEVSQCIAVKREKADKWEKWAEDKKKGEAKEQAQDVEDLRSDVLELKGLVHELVQGLKDKNKEV